MQEAALPLVENGSPCAQLAQAIGLGAACCLQSDEFALGGDPLALQGLAGASRGCNLLSQVRDGSLQGT